MFPTTKPHRSDSFMEPSNQFTYYEDLYGRRNRDEFDEGSVHSCESDNSTEGIRKTAQKAGPGRFFRQFAAPKKKTFPEGSERFGEIRRPGESHLVRL